MYGDNKSIGEYYPTENPVVSKNKEKIKIGDIVKIIKAIDYNGNKFPNKYLEYEYKVIKIGGAGIPDERIVVQNEETIIPVNKSDLEKL